jgi:hypothetical protein
MWVYNSNKNIKIAILGIIVNQVVTIVGVPSYTSTVVKFIVQIKKKSPKGTPKGTNKHY